MILECRIIVCHYSVEPIIQKSQTSTLNILSSNRFTFFTSLAERLPNWFALLAQFGNVKNKQATVVLLQYPFTNLRIVYLMHILIAGRMQTLYSRFLCHSVHQKGKKSPKKKEGGWGLNFFGQYLFERLLSKRGFPYISVKSQRSDDLITIPFTRPYKSL